MPSHNFIDLTGRVFGRLTVIERAHSRGKIIYWRCRCQCGAEREIYGGSLRRGRTLSCGCLNAENRRRLDNKYRSHGQTRSKTYKSWAAMRGRCYRKKNKDYWRYGARGVTVCQRWRESFENFLADMGERPDGCTLDRYPDRNSNYEPGNCRWATLEEQVNNRRTSLRITVFGETRMLGEWCKDFGIGRSTVAERLARGWSVEEALTAPVLKKGREVLHKRAPRLAMRTRRCNFCPVVEN